MIFQIKTNFNKIKESQSYVRYQINADLDDSPELLTPPLVLRVDFLQINLLIFMLNLYTLKSIKATTMIIIILTMTYVTELSGASVRTSRDHHLRTSLVHTMTCGKKHCNFWNTFIILCLYKILLKHQTL